MLKQKVLELLQLGKTQAEIARELNISSGTVSYHANPNSLAKVLARRKERNSQKAPFTLILKDKEIDVESKQVCWKVAEAKALARLLELGYEVFTPFTGGGEIDLIAYKDNISYKVQVKSTSPKPNDKGIYVELMRSSVNYKKRVFSVYTNIDFFLIYDGTNIYKIDPEEGIKSLSLAYKAPINNQVEKIKMAKDYIFLACCTNHLC